MVSSPTDHQKLHRFADERRWRCFYCSRKTHCGLCKPEANGQLRATRDHRIPWSKGGIGIPNNKVLACYECNQDKADRILAIDETTVVTLSTASTQSPLPVVHPTVRYVPASLTAPLWKACSPHWYKSEQLAQFSAQALFAGIGKTFEPYQCEFCNHWHLRPVRDVGLTV